MLYACDLQSLIRKIYDAEGIDRTKTSLAQRHEAQRRYVIKRTASRYTATPKPSHTEGGE